MKQSTSLVVSLLMSLANRVPLQGDDMTRDRSVTWKTVDGAELNLHVFQPSKFKTADRRPATRTSVAKE